MKKILFFALLLFICKGACAQFGALTINNNNATCSICLNLYAKAPFEGNGSVCDIWTCKLCIPPSTTVSFTSPYDFAYGSGPGICIYNTFIGITAMMGILD